MKPTTLAGEFSGYRGDYYDFFLVHRLAMPRIWSGAVFLVCLYLSLCLVRLSFSAWSPLYTLSTGPLQPVTSFWWCFLEELVHTARLGGGVHIYTYMCLVVRFC